MGIIGLILGIIAFVLLIKFIRVVFIILKWLIIIVPIILICQFLIPGNIDEIILITLVIIIAIIKLISFLKHVSFSSYDNYSTFSPSYDYSTYSSSEDYVLNKRSGVIHRRGEHSAETISDRYRKNISYYEAEELVSRGKKYHYKKDP